jgi:2-(3-amino-3-carboxypropyl)histidine synthase
MFINRHMCWFATMYAAAALSGQTVGLSSTSMCADVRLCMQAAKLRLVAAGFVNLIIPQERPLSGGETLGCTAPVLKADCDTIVFGADGRLHLEAMMIANPSVPAYRYAHASQQKLSS